MAQRLAHYEVPGMVAIVTIDHPPMNALDVAAAKKVLNQTRDMPLPDGLDLESDAWAGLTATEDMKEGARAFIEKRKPKYQCK